MKDLEEIHKFQNKQLICQNCKEGFYARGGSKYCVLCKPLIMEKRKRDQNKKKIVKKDKKKIIYIVTSITKRPRAKAIY